MGKFPKDMKKVVMAKKVAARLTKAALLILGAWSGAEAAGGITSAATFGASSCGDVKETYRDAVCCGHPDQSSHYQVVPMPPTKLFHTNKCADQKPHNSDFTRGSAGNANGYFNNTACMKAGVLDALEQAGANVTKGYVGKLDATGRTPITTSYLEAGLCPVNVHWHLGTEHLSVGEFDEHGTGPANDIVSDDGNGRRLASNARLGFRCHKYNANDAKFTTPYHWRHCKSMVVGETYEIHWPHSASGACGTPYQYQSPFYDGVFCMDGIITLSPLNTYTKIGVQSQVFTIVNDENYYYPNLMHGMIVDGEYGMDVGKYTGSTTGTSRDNTICSRYTPITWQVDRKCHLISASSFDKMCADMKTQSDDMSDDLHAHGSRILVDDKLAANNLHRRLDSTV